VPISAEVRKRPTEKLTAPHMPSGFGVAVADVKTVRPDLSQAHARASSAGLLAAVKKTSQKIPDENDPVVAQFRVVNIYMQFIIYVASIAGVCILVLLVLYLVCCVKPVRERFLYLATGDKEVRWTLASAMGTQHVVQITDIQITNMVPYSWFGMPEVFLRIENNPNMPIKTNLKKPIEERKNSYKVFFDRVELNVWHGGDDICVSIMEQDFIGSDVVGSVKLKSNDVLDLAEPGGKHAQGATVTTNTGSIVKGRNEYKMKNGDDNVVGTLHCNFSLFEEGERMP
jgi:hypothetical protein